VSGEAVEVRTIHGQPSWVLRSSTVEMAVTQLGGHMAPVSFGYATNKPMQPYAISPWQDETEGVPQSGSERVLRGDFFCLPFGNGPAPNGEKHPAHGATSSEPWQLIASDSSNGIHTLKIHMETPVRVGSVTRTFVLRDGEHAVYDTTEISGFAGPATLGHHAVLALPQQQQAMMLSSSPITMGMTCPYPFALPEEGNYQSLAIGSSFKSLSRVPSIFHKERTADCSVFPVREGFTDLLQMAQRPQAKRPAWNAAVNSEAGHLWFSLKDAAVLPSTVLWIENKGRHKAPWSGRNCTLGVEDVCSFFDMGIAASATPNAFSERGVKTVHELSGKKPFSVRYIQGAIPVPHKFGRVRKALFRPGKIIFIDDQGTKVEAAVQHSFIQNDYK